MTNNSLTIDNVGNLLQNGVAVGFYDLDTQSCRLYNGALVACPEIKGEIFQPIIASKKSYWWVLLLVFILVVIVFAWFINK